MMIPEAVNLILQAFLIGQGGEIFVLNMGEPVKIVDLAEKLITLSGKKPYQQVDIQFTGMRPGEKLFEELFYDSEALQPTELDKIFRSKTREYDWQGILDQFSALQTCLRQADSASALDIMKQLVPEYSDSTADKALAESVN